MKKKAATWGNIRKNFIDFASFALFATMTTHILDSLVIPSGIVGRFAAERERDIQRHAEAQHREEVLLKIEAELNQGAGSDPDQGTKAAARGDGGSGLGTS